VHFPSSLSKIKNNPCKLKREEQAIINFKSYLHNAILPLPFENLMLGVLLTVVRYENHKWYCIENYDLHKERKGQTAKTNVRRKRNSK